ncbi:MAG: flavodoxin-dependent (E)-4-hydroxy-3-methylbut-2-enyl-diphosphate synthase [Clostridia bacterium]|nr:flavodoxin-dependent (E)-4-hydroxy-3-methylbut-2-enyl-diphosphate synthase [Clostridia bacterium]
MYDRTETHIIRVGDRLIGGGNPISVQSMTCTSTSDVRATVSQILALEQAGCDIVRVAVPDAAAAEAIAGIKKQIHIPLVADIHFDYRLALASIKNGADKVRINPGNIGSADRVKAVVDAAKARGIPIRVGVNGGSLEKPILQKYGRPCAEALVESVLGHVRLLEAMDFGDICISVKSSDVNETVKAYRLLAETVRYPLHLGLTEAGTLRSGTIKSCLALGILLDSGIGDTVRVSLTGNPVDEVLAAKEILSDLGLGTGKLVNFVSCPTCGRTKIDLIGLAGKIEDLLADAERSGRITRPIKVAVMGCAVNGPGEASDADIGLAGGDNCVLLFEKGRITGKLTGDNDVIAAEFLRRTLAVAESVTAAGEAVAEETDTATEEPQVNLPQSHRLDKVCAQLGRGKCLLDVGTDHGLLPIFAIRRGAAERAIASDLRKGPLAKCRENVARAGLTDRIEMRRGDGLDVLTPGEADMIAICGMGGLLIEEILTRGIAQGRIAKGTKLVLAPNTHEAEVRRLVYSPAFERVRETAVREAGQVYIVISCVYKGTDLSATRGPLRPEHFIGNGRLPAYYYRKVLRRASERMTGLRAGGLKTEAARRELELTGKVAEMAEDRLGKNGAPAGERI